MTTPDDAAAAQADVDRRDGIQDGISRFRDLAKYLIAAFAAVGALLVAGSQLASLGKLSVEDDTGRLVAAIAGLALALGMVVIVLRLAVEVLRPVAVEIDDELLDERADGREAGAPERLPGAASTLRAVLEAADEDLLDEATRARYAALGEAAIDWRAYRMVERRFDRAWRSMLPAAAVGALGIAVFAYAANPPDPKKDESAASPVPAAPKIVDVNLTEAGRDALDTTMGEACVTKPVGALVLGGTATEPVIVSLPQGGCAPVQVTLTSDLGVATGR